MTLNAPVPEGSSEGASEADSSGGPSGNSSSSESTSSAKVPSNTASSGRSSEGPEAENRELEEKLDKVTQANSDLKNFMAATDVGMLFLSRELEIRRFTPQVQGYFSVREGDAGRPISEITHQLDYEALEQDARAVLRERSPVERKVPSKRGKWYLAQMCPYRTAEGEVGGVVLSFVDVTELEEARRKQSELSTQLTRAEQDERQRFAQVLHEGLQQSLVGIRMWISSLHRRAQSLQENLEDTSGEASGKKTVEEKSLDEKAMGEGERGACSRERGPRSLGRLSKELEDIEGKISEVVADARRLSIGMSAPALESDGLKTSLEWLRSQMEEVYDLKVRLAAGQEFKLDEALQELLYQVAKELLFNVAEHAGVGRAEVDLESEGEHLVLRVSDEGEGFDPEAAPQVGPGGAFGLTTARERTRQFGGQLNVRAAPDEGTEVTVRVPIGPSSTWGSD